MLRGLGVRDEDVKLGALAGPDARRGRDVYARVTDRGGYLSQRAGSVLDVDDQVVCHVDGEEPRACASLLSATVTAPPPRYDHAVWIVMENHSYDQIIGSPAAPYISQLVAQHGLATDFHAESHPSL